MSTIYEKFAPAVQHHVKTVSLPNGDYYHMLLVDDYVPAVKNGKTGKIVKFDWHDLFVLFDGANIWKPGIRFQIFFVKIVLDKKTRKREKSPVLDTGIWTFPGKCCLAKINTR